MNELVVISGKGGTGKTSVVASFAALAGNAVLADADVDAADLHLVLAPTVVRREPFHCGHEAVIRRADCIGCGACLARCRFEAVQRIEAGDANAFVARARRACNDCEVCARACPVHAAELVEAMVAAGGVVDEPVFMIDPTALNPGGENSGKLVSKVRETARQVAAERRRELILVDGPPGVGCPVIASLTGASQVLIVTEPTLSGAHDLRRVMELAAHFRIPAAVCVNKWDLNPDMTARIEAETQAAGGVVAGRIRYDRSVTAAQVAGQAVVEMTGAPAAADIAEVWARVKP
ncbi:MAG: Electron transport complex subunit RsxB [Lentisphaerae bacterium ADurb.BinA184]|nr:MAG: Electron transport complex subunit RsxB [Lentisphaerae bacterium ADurb.BinA184]